MSVVRQIHHLRMPVTYWSMKPSFWSLPYWGETASGCSIWCHSFQIKNESQSG